MLQLKGFSTMTHTTQLILHIQRCFGRYKWIP